MQRRASASRGAAWRRANGTAALRTLPCAGIGEAFPAAAPPRALPCGPLRARDKRRANPTAALRTLPCAGLGEAFPAGAPPRARSLAGRFAPATCTGGVLSALLWR